MSTVLVGAFKLKAKDVKFELVNLDRINPSHKDNVEILAQNRITSGKLNSEGKHYFDGNGDLKRVQFAILLHKTMDVAV